MRLIDADALHRKVKMETNPYGKPTIDYDSGVKVLEWIDKAPTVDTAPVRHGQWETNSDRPDTLICSVCKCGFDMWKHDPHNFCLNCGAKMDGGDDGEVN